MNDKIMRYVNDGVFSDRQDFIRESVRRQTAVLLESSAECMAFYGHLRKENTLKPEMKVGHISKFIDVSFDGSGLLDTYEYYCLKEPLDIRISVRLPENALDVWRSFKAYSHDRLSDTDFIRRCIIMEMIRLDEDEIIRELVEAYASGDRISSDADEKLKAIIRGRHGYIITKGLE